MEAEVANSLSALWPGDTSHRSMTLVQAYRKSSRAQTNEDDLLPIGLDSHRYRCCGNGVVAAANNYLDAVVQQNIESGNLSDVGYQELVQPV